MKRATDNLISDHQLIEEAMDVMEQITMSENPEPEHLETIVTFIREFADVCHHAKEEGLLFPKLVEKGMPSRQGPIGVMLMEHDKGRGYVKAMAENVTLYKNGNKDALQDVYLNMKGYISLLRDHIQKENNILFRMTDNYLDEEEQKELIDQFSHSEASSDGYQKKQQFIASLKEITAVYQ
jgi:hemerythrin-like domain-containing protein